MVNRDFAEWSRSTSFNISLTQWAITELLILAAYEDAAKAAGAPNIGLSFTLKSCTNYLRRRGLIDRCQLDGYQGNWTLTEAGRHVVALLRLAGFSTE